MKARTLLIIAALLLGGILGSVSAQEADTPGGVVAGYYDWYLGYITGSGEFRNPLVEGAYRDSEYLTQDLIAQIDERLAGAGAVSIGYDLFLCAQDLPESYQYEVINAQADEALVLLREYFGENPRSHNVTLTLRRSDDTWKISDVVCGDTLTPRGVVQDFYTWYLGAWQQIRAAGINGNPLVEGLYREYPYLTANLAARVDEEIANREIGSGDPFLCAQDIPHSSWAHDVREDEGSALVLVQTHYPGNPAPHNLTVALEYAAQQWRISDIICGASPETMAGLLYQQYADRVRYNLDNNIEMQMFSHPLPHWDRSVSSELLARLEAESDLMADPVLCAQDIPERFVVERIDGSDTTAILQIGGEFSSGPDTYTVTPLTVVTLELAEGQWMLMDIACAR